MTKIYFIRISSYYFNCYIILLCYIILYYILRTRDVDTVGIRATPECSFSTFQDLDLLEEHDGSRQIMNGLLKSPRPRNNLHPPLIRSPLWSGGNVASLSLTQPSRIRSPVGSFSWLRFSLGFSLNCKTNVRKFRPHSSSGIIWPS